eukprot:5863027-Prymnesium_polylepis.1
MLGTTCARCPAIRPALSGSQSGLPCSLRLTGARADTHSHVSFSPKWQRLLPTERAAVTEASARGQDHGTDLALPFQGALGGPHVGSMVGRPSSFRPRAGLTTADDSPPLHSWPSYNTAKEATWPS